MERASIARELPVDAYVAGPLTGIQGASLLSTLAGLDRRARSHGHRRFDPDPTSSTITAWEKREASASDLYR
jgi:hypothetical protein